MVLQGLFVAYLALNALRASLPEMVVTTQPNIDTLGIDPMTLAYAAGISLLTSIIFGVIPAVRAASPMLQEGLKEGASSGGGRGTRRLRAALVIAEVSLSTIMLVSAGLLVRSYQRQQHVNPGFDPDNVLTMMIALPDYRYSAPEARTQFFQESVRRISSLAGVESAAFVNVLPFSTYNRGGVFSVEGRSDVERGQEPSADIRVISDGYFDTMRIPLRAGRTFDTRDAAAGARVAIVNEALVRRHFKDQDPLGQRLKLGRIGGPGAVVNIIGVSGSVHHNQLIRATNPGDLLSAGAVATPDDDAGGEDIYRSGDLQRCHPGRNPGCRSRSARLSREADDQARRRFACRAKLLGILDGSLQRHRTDARGHRHLRRRLVRRKPAAS